MQRFFFLMNNCCSAHAQMYANEIRGATAFVLRYVIGFVAVKVMQTLFSRREMVLPSIKIPARR